MTNFDVIESYADDFTNWRIENTGVTSTQKKGDILIFNRTLTEYELSWVKNNMMCSKQQEPDIDL